MMMKTAASLRTTEKWKRHLPLIGVLGAAAIGLIALLAFAGLFVYLPYDQAVNGPKAAEIQKDMEGEFKMIEPLPGATQLRYGSMHKTHQGDVGGDYKTDKSYEEIRKYYDRELNNHSWRFVKEEPVKIWRRDYGGKEAFYCKGIYTATLQYSGQEEKDVGWTYSFGLSWGLFDECK